MCRGEYERGLTRGSGLCLYTTYIPSARPAPRCNQAPAQRMQERSPGRSPGTWGTPWRAEPAGVWFIATHMVYGPGPMVRASSPAAPLHPINAHQDSVILIRSPFP